MDERPEASLAANARQGGQEAFAELVRRHERRVRGIAPRMAGNKADPCPRAYGGAGGQAYPVVTRVEKEKAARQRDRGLDLRDLRAKLAKPPPGEKEVLGLVDRIRQARRAIRERDKEECRGESGAGPAGARDILKEPLDKNLSSL